MMLHSTVKSPYNYEVSFLAVFECVISVSLFVVLGMMLHTYKFYYFALALAPFSILRTDIADNKAIAYAYTLRLMLTGRNSRPFRFFLFWFLLPPLIRIVTTIQGCIERPIETIRSMPQNWVRQALCTDLYYPPEVFPKANLHAAENPYSFRFPVYSEVLKAFYREIKRNRSIYSIAVYVAIIILFLIPYLPSIIYRVTFKATSIVYLPFFWISHISYDINEPWPYIPKRIVSGSYEKDMRTFSYSLIAPILYKLSLTLGIIASMPENYLKKLPYAIITFDKGWSWWQILVIVNILITIAVYYFADRAISLKVKLMSISDKLNLLFFTAIAMRDVISIVIVLGLVFYAARHLW